MTDYVVAGGRYLCTRVLAEGAGDTRLWLADSSDGEKVVLKIMPIPPSADAQEKKLSYFRDEVEAGKDLGGPYIRRLLDSGVDPAARNFGSPQGVLFLVFEYVEYGDLTKRLKDGPITAAEAVNLASAVCTGLGVAHQHPRRYVHRDLKPSNILLPDGECHRAKIADFGISRAREGTRLTSRGEFVGTWLYMAPEQFEDSSNVTEAADIYSLALVVWESLTGQVPLLAADHVRTFRLRCDPTYSPDLVTEGRSAPQLSDVLRAALSSDPVRRPNPAALFADQLLQSGELDGLWKVSREKWLMGTLASHQLSYIDNRPVGGALWVLGDESLRPTMLSFAREGVRFRFKPEGGSASGYHPAWWTAYPQG